nr:CHASE domain-containing protein [Paludibacterium denitrificans]
MLDATLSASVKIRESHDVARPMIYLEPRHKLAQEFEALYTELTPDRAPSMVRIHRLTSVLLSGVLALALLLAEYGLLLNYDRSSEQERLRHWGELGAELLAVRLQEALDHTALLTQSLAHQSASLRNPATLSHIAQTLLRDDSNYRGLGIVRKIMPTQRTAFEAQIANNIRMLKNGHLLPSPSLPVYYPLESYLPDDANALPQGLDMGSLLSSRRTLEMARNRGLPMLLFSTPSNGHRLLDIVTNLDEEGRMLLVNLRSERLVQSSLSTPASNLLLQHVRLVAWTADQPDSPSLDSHPNLPAPVGTPLLTIKHTLGGSDVLFGAYALDSSPPTLSSSSYLMLGLSALLLALLMALHQYQLSANTRLR